MKRLSKKERHKLLKDMCLHCMFFDAHKDKYPDWSPDSLPGNSPAFNDMIESGIRIVAQIFSMLESKDQLRFMRDALKMNHAIEQAAGHPSPSLDEMWAALQEALAPSTKH